MLQKPEANKVFWSDYIDKYEKLRISEKFVIHLYEIFRKYVWGS